MTELEAAESISPISRPARLNPRELSPVDFFRDTVLRRGRGADAILGAAESRPDCPATLSCAATYHLLTDTRTGIGQAIPLLDRAASLPPPENPGGATLIAALAAIARDDVAAADAAFLSLASEAPEDVFAGYVGHLHFLNHGRRDAMLEQAKKLIRANPEDPFALGMLAFALHESGAIDSAWDAAVEADAIDPGIAWVHHAFAHIFLSRRQSEVGLKWLARRAPSWHDCGSSMFTHNWWHAQLLMLELGDVAAALALYDKLIAAEATESVSSFVNASSLLARIELRGGDVGSRWQPLAEEARAHIGEHVLPFIDLHYAIAFAGSGDVVAGAAMKRSAEKHAAGAGGRFRAAWMLAGLPLLDAIGAYAEGDRCPAKLAFDRAIPHLRRIGGSNQQRALFLELADWARPSASYKGQGSSAGMTADIAP